MGFEHRVINHFWFAAIASLSAMFGIHLAIGRLLKPARTRPE